MRSALRPPPLLALLVLLGGCAAQGPFPSLAPRAVERELAGGNQPLPPCLPGAGPTAPVASPAPPVPIERDPALRARIEQLMATAREGDAAFDSAMRDAEPLVSAAGAPGSESWISAQIAVSAAESARTPTTTALADLSALSLRQTAEPANPEDERAVETAVGEAQALADRQTARLEALKRTLSDL